MAWRRGDIGKALRGGPGLWCDLARATKELARARVRLGRASAADLVGRAAQPQRGEGIGDAPLPHRLEQVERVGFAITRMGRRVPWRSDCLVQADAARSWLATAGIVARLHIGSRKTEASGFEAHAWLTVGDLVVTGWDIDGFAQFAEFPSIVVPQVGP